MGGAHAFRCAVTRLSETRGDGATLTADARAALGVAEKDTVRCMPLHQASGEMQ